MVALGWLISPARIWARAGMAIGRGLTYIRVERIPYMSEATSEDQADQRPCLHCMMVELIDEFFAEYPAAGGEPDTVDTDEVLTAVAKTVAVRSGQRIDPSREFIGQGLSNVVGGFF